MPKAGYSLIEIRASSRSLQNRRVALDVLDLRDSLCFVVRILFVDDSITFIDPRDDLASIVSHHAKVWASSAVLETMLAYRIRKTDGAGADPATVELLFVVDHLYKSYAAVAPAGLDPPSRHLTTADDGPAIQLNACGDADLVHRQKVEVTMVVTASSHHRCGQRKTYQNHKISHAQHATALEV